MPTSQSGAEVKLERPIAEKGLENVSLYWDSRRNSWAAKILPGEYYYTSGDEMIVTVLGSCVSVCICDPVAHIGGMNHFMLPEAGGDTSSWDEEARYGIHAMELLINGIMSLGGSRERLEVKLFGGGRIMRNMSDIGRRNIDFARRFIATEGLMLMSSDTGGPWPRKVMYHPATGKAWVKRLKALNNDTIIEREREHKNSLVSNIAKNDDIELF